MMYCIAITFVITFILTYFLVGVITISSGWDALKAGALSAVHDFGWLLVFTAISAAIILLALFAYWLAKYAKRSLDEAAEKQRKERIEQLDILIQHKQQQAQEVQAKLSYYQSELKKINNLQDKINAINKELLTNSYNFIASQERLIEALRERKSKDVDAALMKNTMSKRGAARAQKKFTELLQQTQNTITQEKQVLMLIAGNMHDTIEQLINQINEVKNE